MPAWRPWSPRAARWTSTWRPTRVPPRRDAGGGPAGPGQPPRPPGPPARGTFELPFGPGDAFGPGPAGDLLAFLGEEGHVRQAHDGRWYWASENFPASEISLRTAAPENVVIIDTTGDRPRVIGEVDLFSAPTLVHEGAIYLHESAQFHVDRLDWEERKAYVRRVDVDHYTQADLAVTLKPLDVFGSAAVPGESAARRGHGEHPRHHLQEAEA